MEENEANGKKFKAVLFYDKVTDRSCVELSFPKLFQKMLDKLAVADSEQDYSDGMSSKKRRLVSRALTSRFGGFNGNHGIFFDTDAKRKRRVYFDNRVTGEEFLATIPRLMSHISEALGDLNYEKKVVFVLEEEKGV